MKAKKTKRALPSPLTLGENTIGEHRRASVGGETRLLILHDFSSSGLIYLEILPNWTPIYGTRTTPALEGIEPHEYPHFEHHF